MAVVCSDSAGISYGRWAVGNVGDWMLKQMLILLSQGKKIKAVRPGWGRNSLVTLSKGVENSAFAKTSQVQKGQGTITSVVPAVLLLGWAPHIPTAAQGSINTSGIQLWKAGENFGINGLKQIKCGINGLAASKKEWLQQLREAWMQRLRSQGNYWIMAIIGK